MTLVVLLVLGAGVAITALYRTADHARRAQVAIAQVQLQMELMGHSAMQADPSSGGSLAQATHLVAATRAALAPDVAFLSADPAAPNAISDIGGEIASFAPTIRELMKIGSSPGGYFGTPRTNVLLARVQGKVIALNANLLKAGAEYNATAARTRTQAQVGTAATLVLLLASFMFLYLRSSRARRRAEGLAVENGRLLASSRDDAITDMLTGLGNRRALDHDFEKLLVRNRDEPGLMLAMFDLDGFKQYNDTFGHGAGDGLLARLGERLAGVIGSAGGAYRMGGDEFCIVAPADAVDGASLVEDAGAALTDAGDGWTIGCSWGVAWVPSEATGLTDALKLADQRMYADKASRSSASRQTAAALVQVLAEQGDGLNGHADAVSELATGIAKELGIAEHEVLTIGLAGELHDIGKAAIPHAILAKPGPLDPTEWEFVRRHTIVGERIVAAAPSLSQVALLVRSCHERVDGGGYPDGIAGDEIPLGARIIAVADAYHAMTSDRPYGEAMSREDAIAELKRCSGGQFDPDAVQAMLRMLAARGTTAQAA